MKKRTKVWLCVAAFLVVSGLVMFAAAMSANDWDFTKLSTVKYETNTFDITGEFSNISISTNKEDVVFVRSDNDACKVVCYEAENEKHYAAVENGTLTIGMVDNREWYEYIGIDLDSPKITIYLPETEYASISVTGHRGNVEVPKDFKFAKAGISLKTGNVNYFAQTSDLDISATTGDIRVENIIADAIDLSVSTGNIDVAGVSGGSDIKVSLTTGKINLTGTECKSLISHSTTGDISLYDVVAKETLSLETGTGDINFDRSDAAELYMETNVGDVRGSLLTDKVFIVQTDTGNIDVPKTVTGGRCEITTDTGNIKVEITP